MAIPPSLLAAISSPGGGKVALIVGAGCSKEEPTGLPLAGDCSQDAHRQLVANGILQDGDCDEPWNLSALADLVKEKTGRQSDLVKCLPHQRFKAASPNDGHLIAVALLLEGAIANIITLNYDHALSHALSAIGVKDEVSVINGPGQHGLLGKSNVIYLHRSVDCDFETWILTSEALDAAWKGAWEETVVRAVTAVPVTIFAGMGSACGVLRYSSEKIRKALGQSAELYLADPSEPSESRFCNELSIESANHVRMGWVDFMRDLGERFHQEVVAKLSRNCIYISQREGLVDQLSGLPIEDVDGLTNRVQQMGLLGFGEFRGAVLLDSRRFPHLEAGHLSSIAGLLLAVGCIERTSGFTGTLERDGHVSFSIVGKRKISVLLVDGSTNNLRWLTLESQIRNHENVMTTYRQKRSRRVLAIGATGMKPEDATPPRDITGEVDMDDIIGGDLRFQFIDVEQVRYEPGAIERLLA